MNDISNLIERSLGITPHVQIKLLSSLVVILVFLFLRLVTIKLVWRRTEDVRLRYLWRKSLTYVFSILMILILSNIWFHGLTNLGTFLGLLSAGLAIALKDPVMNIVGWLFIIARHPFSIGDRIQIGDNAGDVIDIRLFQFSLMEIGNWVDAEQSTGRIIHVPNGVVFVNPLANYNQGFDYLWNEIPVLITFESDWRKAKSILLNIAAMHASFLSGDAETKIKKASKKFMISYTKLTPIVYTSVKDSGILLTIRYLCEPHSRRNSAEVIWEDILEEFAKQRDIDFAYPTQRFYNNLSEGKK
ncbi:MAG: mechanosensitive ion channel family protein [Candidatus Neomarinimicrobiota bacterium]